MPENRSLIVPLVLIGGGIFAAVMIGKIAALKSLSFKIRDLQFDPADSNPLLRLIVGINNPTGQSIKVKSVSGTVSVDQQSIARVYQDDPVNILPYNETLYPVPFRIEIADAISSILVALSSGSQETTVRFVGSVNLEGILFPVNVSYKLI